MRPVGTDPTFLALLSKDSGVRMLFGAEILKEYYWPLIYVNGFQFYLKGNATDWFKLGNNIQLSSQKYSEVQVISAISFSGTQTLITISGGFAILSSVDAGAKISRIYRVSDRILQESFGDISEDIEGATLNLFQSSNFNCKLDNSDQWLLNEKMSSGILWTGSEILTATSITETQIDFTNITLSENVFKGGVLTVLSGNAKNNEYPVLSNTTTTATITGTMVSDGVRIGDSLLISLGAGFNFKLYIGLRQLS